MRGDNFVRLGLSNGTLRQVLVVFFCTSRRKVGKLKDHSFFTTSFTGIPIVLQSPVSIAVQIYATKF